MAAAKILQGEFSFRHFFTGLLVVLLLYALLAVYLILVQDKTLQSLENNLASQTVLIDNTSGFDETAMPTHGTPPTEEAHAIQTEEGLDPEDQMEPPETQAETHTAEAVDVMPEVSKALPRAPIAGLFEDTGYGRLPVAKGPDETPFSAYRKPFILNRNQPFIAMAVKDYGLSRELSMQMLSALPSSVSFILSPYSSQPESWVQKAREAGHEIWLQLPMETLDFPLKDPGSKGLLTRVSLQYNQDRLGWLLGSATGYAGVAAYTDSALDNAGTMFKNMARSTFRRGLGFFELNPADSYLDPIAREEGTPRLQNAANIDFLEDDSPAMEQAQFRIEGNGGDVVVIAPSANNISVMKDWIARLQNKGVQSVPLSAVAEMNSGF